MSFSHVCGFIATIRSTPPRRPSQPRSQTRTSYQVGRPWMFDGKMLRGLTGTPMRRMALAKSAFADAEPEPLTFANLTTKSLVEAIAFTGQSLTRQALEVLPLGDGDDHLPVGHRRLGVHLEAPDQLGEPGGLLLQPDGRGGGIVHQVRILLRYTLQLAQRVADSLHAA